MNPVSLNSSFLSSALAGMRPELPKRNPGVSPGSEADTPIGSPQMPGCTPELAPGGFEKILGGFVKEVNAKQTAAGDAVTGVLSGQNVPLHQAMIAMEEASVSFQLMVEVRNKLLEGYQELMRLQI